MENKKVESYKTFKETNEKIWSDYNEYGEVVLEKKIPGEDVASKALKEAIISSENTKALYVKLAIIWKEYYQKIITTVEELVKECDNINTNYVFQVERENDMSPMCVSSKLFEKLKSNRSFFEKENKLYIVKTFDFFKSGRQVTVAVANVTHL